MKKINVPIRDCFVETGESLGTGIKENMSITVNIRKSKFGC